MHRSCEMQLLELVEGGRHTDILINIMDFANAFDNMNHSLLLHKLHHYGIGGEANRWIGSTLTDRHKAVVMEGT